MIKLQLVFKKMVENTELRKQCLASELFNVTSAGCKTENVFQKFPCKQKHFF